MIFVRDIAAQVVTPFGAREGDTADNALKSTVAIEDLPHKCTGPSANTDGHVRPSSEGSRGGISRNGKFCRIRK